MFESFKVEIETVEGCCRFWFWAFYADIDF
jgi:hypothetical protein